jgi:hypothetical protein
MCSRSRSIMKVIMMGVMMMPVVVITATLPCSFIVLLLMTFIVLLLVTMLLHHEAAYDHFHTANWNRLWKETNQSRQIHVHRIARSTRLAWNTQSNLPVYITIVS